MAKNHRKCWDSIMKNNYQRLLSLFLVIVTVALFTFTACSTATTEEKPSDTVDAAAETTSKYLDGLPETMDFGGEVIRYVSDQNSVYRLTERSLVSEELTGDIVDDAIYKRNEIIKDRFNVDFELVKSVPFPQMAEPVRQSVLSNSDDYDIVAAYMHYGAELASEGMLYNLNDLPNLDFTQDYWSQSMIEGLAYKDAIFWCTGDLALRYIGGMYVSFINKTIWSDYFPDTDYYQLALDGQWTLDTIYEMSSVIYDDLDTDSQQDEDDMWGFAMNPEDPLEATMTGCLAFVSQKDDDGVPYIDINYDRVIGYFEKIYELVYNNPGGKLWTSDDSNTIMKDFAYGHIMCVINKLFMSEAYLREMEHDFAVLPSPKYDAEQEQYNTTIHDGLTIFGIPVTNTKVEMTTMILEALAAESYRTVTPVYYEMALKIKYVRDDLSAIMIDLVREGVVNDFAIDFGNAVGYNNSGVCFQLRGMLTSKTQAYMSTLESYEMPWQASLDELLENMEKYSS